jgi:arginine:ornithine antiporter/lysine permease
MFIAAGLEYMLLVAVLFAPGTILYVIARREQGADLFTARELAIFGLVIAAAAAGVWGLATGAITT